MHTIPRLALWEVAVHPQFAQPTYQRKFVIVFVDGPYKIHNFVGDTHMKCYKNQFKQINIYIYRK